MQKSGFILLAGAAVSMVLTLIFTTSAWAGWKIRSEAKFKVDKTVIEEAISSVWQDIRGTESTGLPAQNFNEPFQFSIGAINADFQYFVQRPTQIDPSLWQFDSRDLQAAVRVGAINASQVIEKIQNGTIIRIELKAECRPFTITLPKGAAHLQARIRTEVRSGRIELSTEQLNLNWSDASWQIPHIHCDAPDGFDGIVRHEVQKQLASSRAMVMERLRAEVRGELDRLAVEARNFLAIPRELNTSHNNFTVKLNPGETSVTYDGTLLVDAELEIDFPNVPGPDVEKVVRFADEDFAKSNGTSLLLPFETIQSMFFGSYLSGGMKIRLHEDELPFFQELRRDYSLVDWLWPDLLEFEDPDLKFAFDVYPVRQVRFGSPSMHWDGRIRMPMHAQLVIDVWAPSRYEIKRIPLMKYVTFYSDTRTRAAIKVRDGKLSFQMEKPSLRLDRYWNEQYLERYPWTNTNLPIGTIEGPLADMMSEQAVEMDMPEWQITPGKVFRADRMVLEGNKVRLYWEVKTDEKEQVKAQELILLGDRRWF